MGPKKFDERYLESNGIDPEEVKKEWVGNNGGSYDIYNGDTITIQSKYGRTVIDTEMSKYEFFERYQDNDEEETK